MRRFLTAATALAAILTSATVMPAAAQGLKISQFPNLPNAAASLTDAFPAQSTSCTGGNCRITVAQIAAAVLQTMNSGLTSASTGTSGASADAAQITGKLGGATNVTAQYILNCAIASQGCSSGVFFGTDGMRGVNVVNPGSGNAFINAGVTGYVLNQSAMNGALGPAVALNGFGACVVDNSWCWGLNALVSDNAGFVPSNGQGRMLFNELNINVTSPNTGGSVLQLGGTFLAAAKGINGLYIGAPNDPNHVNPTYANAIAIANGAAFDGLTLGTSTRSAPGGSQAIVFPYWGLTDNNEHTTSMYTTGDGTVVINSDNAGNLDLLKSSLFLPSNNGILVNANSIMAADSGTNVFFGSGGSFQNVALGNGHATISVNGPIVIQTGTPASSSTSCSVGNIMFDQTYLYTCIYNNNWRRIALSSF